MQSIRPKLAQIPGLKTYLINPPPIRIGGYATGGQYQLTLQSPDMEELYHYAPILEQKIRAVPGLIDVNTDLKIKNPQITVTVDRDKASTLGLSAQQVESALYGAYGSEQVSTIYTSNNTYQVIMELLPEFQKDPSALNLLPPGVVGGMLKHVDFVASDVPGFTFPVSLAGASLDRYFAFGPTIGTAVNVTLLSYLGSCCVGVTTDAAAVPDACVFGECLSDGFEQVLALGGDHTPVRLPLRDGSSTTTVAAAPRCGTVGAWSA